MRLSARTRKQPMRSQITARRLVWAASANAAIAAHLRRQDAETPQRRQADPGSSRLREVAIYARVAASSPHAGVDTDLDAQIAACQAFARQRGQDAALVYREATDDDTLERPRLTDLRAFIAHRWIATVLVTTLDRLTGDPVLLGGLRAEWAALGVAIVAVMGKQ